jgi:rsbT antagonist protein RsbS
LHLCQQVLKWHSNNWEYSSPISKNDVKEGVIMAEDISISVIRVRDVLLVTIPSDPDDDTISALQDKVLKSMEQYQPKGLVLDISLVETLDSFFARTISETAEMVSLMGGKTVISGMRPSVAITATQFGLTLGKTRTALGVDMALDMLENDSTGGAHNGK